MLVDITCDSDGKIDRFIDLRDIKTTLPLHELNGDDPYYLGIFLTGAYQDVLGMAHNLFGRVNEAHIRVDDDGWKLELFVNGQKARRVIENMGYEAPQLHACGGDHRRGDGRQPPERRRSERDARAVRQRTGGLHLPGAGVRTQA